MQCQVLPCNQPSTVVYPAKSTCVWCCSLQFQFRQIGETFQIPFRGQEKYREEELVNNLCVCSLLRSRTLGLNTKCILWHICIHRWKSGYLLWRINSLLQCFSKLYYLTRIYMNIKYVVTCHIAVPSISPFPTLCAQSKEELGDVCVHIIHLADTLGDLCRFMSKDDCTFQYCKSCLIRSNDFHLWESFPDLCLQNL